MAVLWWSPPATYGVIHVESPEIYTRERLVNDRYNQDHWLRERLEMLDRVNDLSSGYLAVAVNADVRLGLGSAQPAPAATPSPTPLPERADTPRTGADGAMPLPFQEDLSLRLSIRDLLRQQILENMLDDRHDLSGNTVFGLKFDTSIIPGSNTRNPAYVKARVSIYNYRDLIEPGEVENIGGVKRYERDYYQGYTDGRWKESAEYALYVAWLKDFQARLNKVASSIVKQNCKERTTIPFAWDYAQELSRNVFSLVAGLEPGNVIVAKSPAVQANFFQVFPGELYDYVKVSVSAFNVCNGGVGIIVAPRIENLYLIDRKIAEMKGLTEAQRPLVNRILFSLNQNYESIATYSPAEVDWLDPANNVCGIHAGSQYAVAMLSEIDPSLFHDLLINQQMEVRKIRYDVTSSLIALMSKYGARSYRSRESPSTRITKLATPESPVQAAYETLQLGAAYNESSAIWTIINATQPSCVVEFPLGFFNFIEKIAKSESYAYAVFPKSERKVFKLQELVQLAAGGGASREGLGGLSGMLGLARALDSTDAVALSIGYGDGSPDGDSMNVGDKSAAGERGSGPQQGANFGWVILPEPGDNRLGEATLLPTQKSQLALVSVPAFAKDIIVRLETGWLDDEAQPIAELRTVYSEQNIRVPTDFDAVDSLLAFSGANRRPLVIVGEVSPQVLRECAPAKVLIPGFRLWQSTLVTIGSQESDKITVLPNMEGIIAEFKTIPRIPTIPGTRDAGIEDPPSPELSLRVWTSEGVTDPLPMTIEKGRCEVNPRIADQGTITP